MAGKKRVAESAAGDTEAEASTAPKAIKSGATKAQPVKAKAEPRMTRKQTAKESAANSDVDPEAVTVKFSNGKAEVKKRARKGKVNPAVSQSDNEEKGQEEQREPGDVSPPEAQKVEVNLPKTRSQKPKATEPEKTSKTQEKKVVAKKGPAKAKPEAKILKNGPDAGVTEPKATKAKRGAKKVDSDVGEIAEPAKAGPSKAEPTKVDPPTKRGRNQKVDEESTETTAAPITEKKPKGRARKAKAKADPVDGNEAETEALEPAEDASPAAVAEPAKAEPKKRTRKAKA